MRQYARFKQRHPDCLLLFRIGDFYEMFDDDAVRASKAIGLTLTQRTAGIPMAGVPFHQLENYLRKFLAAGFRVAVCEQTQDAAEAKGIVERAVTRVLTAGTLVDENLLDAERSNTIAAVSFRDAPHASGRNGAGSNGTGAEGAGGLASVAMAELSTGAFTVLSCAAESLGDELARRQVSEVVYAGTADGAAPPRVARALTVLGVPGTPRPQWEFSQREAGESLRKQFGVATLAGFGLGDDDPEVSAAGALVRYLRATQAPAEEGEGGAGGAGGVLAHLRPPRREAGGEHLEMEASTLRALEVDRTIREATGAAAGARGGSGTEGSGDGSLAGIFAAGVGKGSCRTAMGKRLLREWLRRPSCRLEEIARRHGAVGCLVEDRRLAGEVGEALGGGEQGGGWGVQDVARIAARVALGRATPRDLVALGRSLTRVGALMAAVEGVGALSWARERLGAVRGELEPVGQAIIGACVESPPGHMREGGLFRDGHDQALDEARTLQSRAGQWCAEYQAKLIAEHDLPSLKVGYNKIFGYYIELPKAQAARAPAVFARRQTLTGAERYVTPELKAFEDQVTTATARAVAREQALFEALCGRVVAVLGAVSAFGEAAAEVDVLLALADKAAARRWVRPVMVDAPALRIAQGRHPVLDESLGTNFVPNDVSLGAAASAVGGGGEGGGGGASLALITGPNMAGKSTFIRQTALLVLLAHAGSFVPAESAEIGVTDRIFTRVGADDALHAGQSTFMVEMTETASILHGATDRSLVVLDEIGRGTSTLDGLSLAWAIAETLAGGLEGAGGLAGVAGVGRGARPRTLFATHYHEITQLEEMLPGRVRNLHVAVREWGDQIVFLHRILEGRTDRSYGVHVAKLAGLPGTTIARAKEILASLSVEHEGIGAAGGRGVAARAQDVPPLRSAGRGRVGVGGEGQLGLFTEFVPHPAVDALREVKIEAMSPMQAFDELRRIKALADDAG